MTRRDDISTEELLHVRLFNQRITVQKEKTPGALMKHFGAMQAQDYPMAKWAIGTRLSGSGEGSVQSAVDRGSIIRTHVLRPTWHFVSPQNLSWMLMLTSPRLHAADKARLKQLGITTAIIKKSNRMLLDLLKGRSVTREEIMSAYAKEKIKTSDYRGGHLLFKAEIEGLICSGKFAEGKHTYALFADRIPGTKQISKEGALKKLARLYFQSHGPASVQDFTWWSGLSPGDAREALVLSENTLQQVRHNKETLYFIGSPQTTPELQQKAFLLPAYDEYTIAYKERSAMIDKRFLKKTISTNGIFFPLVIIEGKIAGLWKKQAVKNKLQVTVLQFSAIDKKGREALESPARALAEFYRLEPELKYTRF